VACVERVRPAQAAVLAASAALLALAAAAVPLSRLARQSLNASGGSVPVWVVAPFAVVGLVVAWRRPGNPLGWNRPTCRCGSAVVIKDHKSGLDNLCWPTISADFRGAGCRHTQRTCVNLVADVVESAAADTEHIHHGTRCGR